MNETVIVIRETIAECTLQERAQVTVYATELQAKIALAQLDGTLTPLLLAIALIGAQLQGED